MTPKEKAQELVFKKFGCKKQYALNAVQEIISEMSDYYDEYDCTKTLKKIEYWQEVKQELEKL